MNNKAKSYVLPTGLAIFSMFFGAGNLMFPIAVGMNSGDKNIIGMIGFLLSAVFLPLTGLIGMILFDGNYERFFKRLGLTMGSIVIGICMAVIGPLLAIPRIVTLSHTMIAPFIPIAFLQQINLFSSFVFALIFLGITFLATFRENKIVAILGNVISPALLISLSYIIIKGFLTADQVTQNLGSATTVFTTNFIRGYETLDLLGAIFFSSMILGTLKNMLGQELIQNPRRLVLIGFQAGILGLSLLGLVYIGMSYLGVFHGVGLGAINEGELFREISFRVVGAQGAFVIGVAVLMACLSTSIALSAVVGEYIQQTIFRNKIGFVPALILALLACVPLSTFGLDYVLQLTGGPLVYIGTPVIFTITLANIAYKLFGFKPIKIPVLLAFVAALISYLR